MSVCGTVVGWLGSRVVSVLDSGAEGPGFKSLSKIFGFRKLESLQAIVRCCLCDPKFSRFSRTPTCDGQTDRHRAMASTADA